MRSILHVFFLVSLLCCNDKKPVAIGIQPYNQFDKKVTQQISNALYDTYGLKVYTLKAKPLPKQAFINIRSPRYRADSILKILKVEKADTLDYIIGVTDKDLSTTKRDIEGNIKKPESKYGDWGIFGLGYRPGPSCVISSFRLNNTSQKNYLARIKKVAIHEIGHNLGLQHCPTPKCVMQDAVESIRTVDQAGLGLCSGCKKEIELH